MKKRKPQIRSEKCALVTLGVSFNICDPEQAKDLEYADSLINFSGEVKQWIRVKRLGSDTNQAMSYLPVYNLNYSKNEPLHNDFAELSEEDSLNSLI